MEKNNFDEIIIEQFIKEACDEIIIEQFIKEACDEMDLKFLDVSNTMKKYLETYKEKSKIHNKVVFYDCSPYALNIIHNGEIVGADLTYQKVNKNIIKSMIKPNECVICYVTESNCYSCSNCSCRVCELCIIKIDKCPMCRN